MRLVLAALSSANMCFKRAPGRWLRRHSLDTRRADGIRSREVVRANAASRLDFSPCNSCLSNLNPLRPCRIGRRLRDVWDFEVFVSLISAACNKFYIQPAGSLSASHQDLASPYRDSCLRLCKTEKDVVASQVNPHDE